MRDRDCNPDLARRDTGWVARARSWSSLGSRASTTVGLESDTVARVDRQACSRQGGVAGLVSLRTNCNNSPWELKRCSAVSEASTRFHRRSRA